MLPCRAPDGPDLDELLDVLGWDADELDCAIPPAVAGGHLVLAAATPAVLARPAADASALRATAARCGWTSVLAVHRAGARVLDAVEPLGPPDPDRHHRHDRHDPAAARALVDYLLGLGLLPAAATSVVLRLRTGAGPARRLTVTLADP